MDASFLNPSVMPLREQNLGEPAPRRLSVSPDPHAHFDMEKLPEPQRAEAFGGSVVMSNLGNRPEKKPRKTLVLCFDGTGNQFHGDSSDSNILKIFRMLDRNSGKGFHYYQPGIGTYVANTSLSSTGSIAKLKNWYLKAKDSAVGSSFDVHVVGGYKFLMKYYSPGDNIYMFGFSRGSYTVRFLAEMIDWVGLITHGNEEMIQFAWKTFSKWKSIDRSASGAREREKKAYDFMVAFRETFSRPVRRIRFLGLFDTVNSVPRFENAVLSRKRIPFSAISSAKIIRHAVSIDERRAKFRADLVSHGMDARKDIGMPKEDEPGLTEHHLAGWVHHHQSSRYSHKSTQKDKQDKQSKSTALNIKPGLNVEGRGRTAGEIVERPASRYRSHSRSRSHRTADRNSISIVDFHSAMGSNAREGSIAVDNISMSPSQPAPHEDWDDDSSSDGDENEQDIEELWFPGGHADIGGGWELEYEDEIPLSHIPLVWIVREAQRAGLELDEEKMEKMGCLDDNVIPTENNGMPTIELSGSPTLGNDTESNEKEDQLANESKFKKILIETATKGKVHDCLRYGQGLPAGSVLRWRVMEYMPFRRLDMTDDGKWKPIRWPLPRGEVRDMPPNAKVHISAIRRLETVPDYRPGNLVYGGGGRGVIRAPKSAGNGEWDPAGNTGDIVAESVIRRPKVLNGNGKKAANGHKKET